MPYIGNQPGTGVRNRFIYTATASQTTFSGADDNGKTLKYADSDFVDVFLNGICLVPVTDYTSTSKTSIVLTQAASLNDTLEVVAYDIATISDTVSKADGGTFEANVTFAAGADIITATAGTDNVRLGENAGAAIASGGNQNTLIGKDAGTSITTGVENTLVGYRAGDAITDADFNVGVGWGALGANVLGSKSVAMGTGALDAQNPASATDMHNTAVGHGAGGAVTTATRNTAVGSSAGASNQTSLYNTYVGYGAGENTTGQGNTFIGDVSGNSVVAGEFNTLLGQQAGNAITSGDKNTVIGRFNGNQGSLDIRTSDKNIVLSDGDGNPLGNIHSSYLRFGETQGFSNSADHSSGIFRSERGSIIASADADDFKTSGFYRFDQNASNLPASNTFFAMVIFGNSGNVVTQIAVQLQNTVSYVRSYNSAWSSWARLDT